MAPQRCGRRFTTGSAERLLAAVFLACVAPLLAAGKLDEVRDAVRGEGEGSGSSSGGAGTTTSDTASTEGGSGSSGGGGGHRDDDDAYEILDTICLFLPPAWPLCMASWVVERRPFHRSEEDGFGGRFHSFPYADGAPGHMIMTLREPEEGGAVPEEDAAAPEEAEAPFAEDDSVFDRWFSLRVSGEYAYDLDGVHRPGAALLFDSAWRFGFETGWAVYLEPLPGGRVDSLTFGDLNVFWRFAQDERAEFRLGLGVRLMIDADRVDAGINASYAMDVFPIRPLVISMVVDVGSLGETLVVHGRGSLGVMLSRLEVYAGYDIKLIDPVLFQGPMGGLRVWY